MAINGYVLERYDGKKTTTYGECGWEGLLSSKDILEPGRVKSFTVISDGYPFCIELAPDDILAFVRRTRLLQEGGTNDIRYLGARVIFGKRKDPNSEQGAFYVVWPNGEIQISHSFNGV